MEPINSDRKMADCSFHKIDLFNIGPTNKNNINDNITFN